MIIDRGSSAALGLGTGYIMTEEKQGRMNMIFIEAHIQVGRFSPNT